MSTIAERIAEFAKRECDGNMSEFARRIGVTPACISRLNKNPNGKPSELLISNICNTYNVSEKWLRTGEGEMYESTIESDEISRFIAEIMRDEPNNEFKRKFIRAASKLTPEGWDALQDFIESLSE